MKIERVMAFDVGSKKTGIAIGQNLTASAQPVSVLYCPIAQLKAECVEAWIDEWKPDYLICGMPQLADGKPHPLESAIRRFAKDCEQSFDLNIYFVNETLTSHEAKKRMPNKKHNVDAMAAVIMLEDWFAAVLR